MSNQNSSADPQERKGSDPLPMAEPSSGPTKNEPTPERAAEEKKKQLEHATQEK